MDGGQNLNSCYGRDVETAVADGWSEGVEDGMMTLSLNLPNTEDIKCPYQCTGSSGTDPCLTPKYSRDIGGHTTRIIVCDREAEDGEEGFSGFFDEETGDLLDTTKIPTSDWQDLHSFLEDFLDRAWRDTG